MLFGVNGWAWYHVFACAKFPELNQILGWVVGMKSPSTLPAEVTVTVALADLVLSATLVAVTVYVPAVEGAV